MRITQIHIKADELQPWNLGRGLTKEIRMHMLGQIVVLAGPNGSGKSRFLDTLVSLGALRDERSDALLEERLQQVDIQESRMHAALNVATSESQKNSCLIGITGCTGERKSILLARQLKKMINCDSDEGPIRPIQFFPDTTNLANAEELTPKILRQNAENFRVLGFRNSTENAPSYIKATLQRAFNATHPDFNKPEETEERQTYVEAGKSLKEIIQILLGDHSDPRYTVDGQISIFGQTNYFHSLSMGQKILVQFAAALHAQGTKLREALLFVDEPELHLHPGAAIELVDKLKALCTHGQIWIATHCLPLIAHLVHDDPNSLWYMHDGEIEFSGRKPELVLDGLFGGHDGVQRLQRFTMLPSQLAATRFLSECMLPPGTVGANVADPQTNQIAQVVQELLTKKGNGALRLLDFGAGQGRLLPTARAMSSKPVSEWLDYYAFDKFDSDRARCVGEIAECYPGTDASVRYFNDLHAIKAKLDDLSFDLAVMCNVLHEIDPEEWISLLGQNSCISQLLRADGYLLVVEDYQIPVGETAHRHGFLLLDEAELKSLFKISEKDRKDGHFVAYDAREGIPGKDGRLKAHLIRSSLLSRITSDSQAAAIRGLRDRMREEISAAKTKGSTTFADGHRYALAAQLYANASIWLDLQGK